MIDLSSGGEAVTVPLPDGTDFAAIEPTADELRLLWLWRFEPSTDGRVTNWHAAQRILLAPDRVELARRLTIGQIARITWWLWNRWCIGEEAADEWDANRGKALALTLTRAPAETTSTSTDAASTTSRRASTSRTTSRKKSPANSQAGKKARRGQPSGTGGTSSSPTSTSATASTSTPADPAPGSSPSGPPPGSPTASSAS